MGEFLVPAAAPGQELEIRRPASGFTAESPPLLVFCSKISLVWGLFLFFFFSVSPKRRVACFMIQLFTNFLPFDVSGPVVTGRESWWPNPEPLAGLYKP